MATKTPNDQPESTEAVTVTVRPGAVTLDELRTLRDDLESLARQSSLANKRDTALTLRLAHTSLKDFTQPDTTDQERAAAVWMVAQALAETARTYRDPLYQTALQTIQPYVRLQHEQAGT